MPVFNVQGSKFTKIQNPKYVYFFGFFGVYVFSRFTQRDEGANLAPRVALTTTTSFP
jgi:hypothetical protein